MNARVKTTPNFTFAIVISHVIECNYNIVIIVVSVECEWGPWMTGECSATCGDGVQKMTRSILAVEQFGGKPCEGESSMEEPCSNEECPPGNKIKASKE